MAQLSVTRVGAVAVCTIANPPMGFMDRDTVAELDVMTRDFEADDDVRAVLLVGGVAGVFVRHYSVVELESMARLLRQAGVTVDPAHALPERDVDRVFRRIETMGKPVIAALNGTALGGGFELALACDLRIAEAGDFAFGLPEVNVGLVPGGGGTQKLARLIGTARALEMTLRGRTVSPAEALALGMVHEVVAAGGALARAIVVAQEIAARPPLAVAHIKRLVRAAVGTPLDEGLARERTLFLDVLVSDAALALMHEMNEGKRDIRDLPGAGVSVGRAGVE